MGKQTQTKNKETSNTKNKKEAKPLPTKKASENEEERNGIIPEGMDFKKFLGCGG